eukprot:158864_1
MENSPVKNSRWRSIDYVYKNHKETDNPNLRIWFDNQKLMDDLRSDTRFNQLVNHRRLKKEFTEAASILFCIRSILVRLNKRRTELSQPQIDPKDLIVFDVCSGKGFPAILLSYAMPGVTVHLLDKDKKMVTDHLKPLQNVNLSIVDVRHCKFSLSDFIDERIPAGKVGIVVGTHLCGVLSEIIIDGFCKAISPDALIVIPCCLPSKRRYETAEIAKKAGIDPFDYWVDHLRQRITGCDTILSEDSDMLSKRNAVLTAFKINT